MTKAEKDLFLAEAEKISRAAIERSQGAESIEIPADIWVSLNENILTLVELAREQKHLKEVQ